MNCDSKPDSINRTDFEKTGPLSKITSVRK